MSFGKRTINGRGVRHYLAAALVVMQVTAFLLPLFAMGRYGHSAPSTHYNSPYNASSNQDFVGNSTIDAGTSGNTTISPSPYSVARGLTLAPYQTGDWGTIEQDQKYGVNGLETPHGDPLPPSENKIAEPEKAAPASDSNAEGAGKLSVSTLNNNQTSKKVIRLFSTVDFRSPLKDMPKWERVLQREMKSPSFTDEGLRCGGDKTAERWLNLRNSLQGAGVMEKVKAVNNFFNKWPYRSDNIVWGVEDYWAVPCEFVVKSGDCEDYAIAKYFALRNLGVPADIMRIAAVKDTIRGIGHAVLVVYIGDDAYVLDNLSNLVLSHKRLKHYRPLFTVNENYLWRHVKPIAGPDSK